MDGRRDFLLMNKDEKVMHFTSERNEFGEILLEEQEKYDRPLPIGFTDIQTFIAHRQAPKHRKHIHKLLMEAGCEDLEGFLLISKALSLNDTFWVKETDSKLSWSDVSLYQNDFNEVIAQLAFAGGDETTDFSSTSPEYGTDGTYAKCWVREENQIILLKSGSDTHAIEPYSDFLASQLAKIICRDTVPYELSAWHGKTVSTCPLFTSEQVGYVPAVRLLDERKHNQVAYLLDYFARYDEEDAFRRMIVLDALLLNEDRHAGNYGFMVDNESQKILRMAPVFDHNRSLLYGFHGQPGEEKEYIKLQIPRIGAEFNTTAHSVLTPEIRMDLENLRGFSFQQDVKFPMDKGRLDMLSCMVNKQITNILDNRQLYNYR